MPEARPLPTELLPLISALVVSHFITLTVCCTDRRSSTILETGGYLPPEAPQWRWRK
ncbi:unnamed protein product, partial [Choristocarpus tenellus]